MYNLGEHFKLDYAKAISPKESIIKGKKFRITILTSRLVRLEYNEEGKFEDRPTELVWYRNLETPKFEIKEDANYLELTTEYFKMSYAKNKPFWASKVNPTANFKMELLGTDRVWYYGHPEVRNFKTAPTLLDDTKSPNGLYSADGMASFSDETNIMGEAGTVLARETNIDTYVFMYKDNFEEALKDYYKITGFPALVPRYALGNWWSKNNNYDDLELKSLVDEFERKEIPLSIVLLDEKWHTFKMKNKNEKTNGFNFNNENFKNPKAMISYLHSKFIRLGLNVDPSDGIYDNEKYYAEALKYVNAEGDKIPFNVYNPKFIDIYLKMFIHPLDNDGVDFFWLSSYDKNNMEALALLKHYQFYDMMRDFKRRPMVMGYDFKVAPHRYPVSYSGNTVVSFETLKKVAAHNEKAFNNGAFFWAHDIGGYHDGVEDNELYIRFIQLGVFSPILKFGSDEGKYYKREPWRWNVKTYSIAKDYLNLRHKLIPYIYSEAYKNHKFGAPLIKPLYYTNPVMYDDPLFKEEYYFGEEFFVCPITSKKDYVMDRVVHKFYMPNGLWYDFKTGKKFPGDKIYVSFFKDEDYPVFVKSGSIIPLGINENLNDTTPPKDMEIHIFPGQNNTYTLFEDDGESDLYRKNFFLLTEIDYNYMPNNYSLIIRSKEGKTGIVPEKRNYKIVFRNTKRTDEVTVYSDREQVSFKTYVDGSDFVVEVKDINTIGQLTINCKGKNIEIDAVRLINDEIEDIISDLQIKTVLKEKIDKILFSDLPIKKKRIEIRKLGKKGLEKKFIKVFLKLLEHISEV